MLNPFRKKKPVPERKIEKPVAEKFGAGSVSPPATRPSAQGQRRMVGFLIAPHLTEKTSAGSTRRWYTFRVRSDLNKVVIRRAVEDRYGVTVERVRIVPARPKTIRLGRIEGVTPGFKKAMVKVRAGQSIEFI